MEVTAFALADAIEKSSAVFGFDGGTLGWTYGRHVGGFLASVAFVDLELVRQLC
jgi:hypothetical protein